ncbi:MAG TPA: DISARM system SNF2-like helicase DrmD [Ktedonobacteraceae bacterium]|nr:DISARM system SNF2-like helicase DrmD [Ktedonobacteraceae bacterium]
MNSLVQIPEPGQLVDVRRRRYTVIDITQSPLPPDLLSSRSYRPQHLVTLSSVEDDALGEVLQVIWEIEPGTRTIERTPLPEPVGFDTPQRLDTFLHAVRWGSASSADIRAIQAPFRSGIQIENYQLDPVTRAIQMPRANLLIADDVGLGKTIEAGLVVQELLIRHRARRILILCPASLQIQWHDQMRDKFGLDFRIIDSKALSELRRERGIHVNPWTHFPRLITSIDFLKRERPLRLLSEILPPEGDSPYPRKFDLLILDEAHNVAPSGSGKYATDSQRTLAVRRLAPHFEHKLFLSATPHNGYRESFSALLELLDNQRFARGVEPDPEQLQAVMVRRLKSELPKRWDGSSQFPERKITPLLVHYTQPERDLHQLLQDYSQSRLSATTDNTEQYATKFVAMLLKKRLFSSPAAFFKTLTQHEQTLSQASRRTTVTRRPGLGILRSKIEQIDEEQDDDNSLLEATTEALEVVAPLFHTPTTQERSLLSQMLRLAESSSLRADSKAQELIGWLHRVLKPHGRWSDERVIIFTEYKDTLNWLYGLLVTQGFAEEGPDHQRRLLTLFGGMDMQEREQIKAAFQADPADSSVRILLATDAASEGIDLQNHCSRLIHYEIPWNPNRLEQRNGRIDRHGQHAPAVEIYHFVSSSYSTQATNGVPRQQLDADLEFLMQAVEKIERIREDLGNVGPVIATQVEEAMLGRRTTLDTRRAEENAPSRRLQAFQRKQRDRLEERIRQLSSQLQESMHELELTPANIQAVVEVALELARQPPLQPITLHDPHGKHESITTFAVPDLSGSWAPCTEGLSHPYTQQRRPIVFDHALAKDRDDVVLAHMNHRLVAMSLRLLRAEIWSASDQGKLYRVTARTVAHYTLDTPAVIAHARLLILGGDNQRLHEELVVAGGYLREGRFVRMNEGQLKTTLAAQQDAPVSERMQQQLAHTWPAHKDDLMRALERRKQDRATSLQRTLADRAEKEQRDITSVLKELQKNIRTEIEKYKPANRPAQLQLEGFSNEEYHQLERDIDALEYRASQIDGEIIQEVERIQTRFAAPQARLFPVAVTYLVPERFAH